MESRRFDSFVRAFAKGSSRRGMLRGAALASTAVLVPAAVRADAGVPVVGSGAAPATPGAGGASPSGGASGASGASGAGCAPCVCPNTERPAHQVSAAPPFPALIVMGTCDKYDTTNAIDLKTVGDTSTQPKSQTGVVAVVSSLTSISTPLTDLLKANRALIIQASGTDTTLVACGNLGSKAANNALSVGITEQNGSAFSGIATFTSSTSGVVVNLLVARGLFETVSGTTSGQFAVGSYVTANVDLNLRKTPADNGAIVTVLGQGSELKVTGAAQGKWLPVDDVASGDSGFVDSSYVTVK